MDAMASGQKFAERSRALNGRSPIRWQIELTDQVTWCSTATRTRPAQKNAGPGATAVNHPQRSPGGVAQTGGRGGA
jgi:hypothetical protein